jgi:hypothetical protein
MKKTIMLLAHAFVLWILCGATMAAGRAAFGLATALVVHVVAAPLWAVIVSCHYFRKYPGAPLLGTAAVFLAVVVALDAGLVAPVFEKSYAMFRSLIGTWIPFTLIFLATLLTGLAPRKSRART